MYTDNLILKLVKSYFETNFFSFIFSQNLMKELEEERERRWKSEQASMKLVDHIKKLQVKGKILLFIILSGVYLSFLLLKARHRDSDLAAVAAALANFLKAFYFRRWKTWMLHTL